VTTPQDDAGGFVYVAVTAHDPTYHDPFSPWVGLAIGVTIFFAPAAILALTAAGGAAAVPAGASVLPDAAVTAAPAGAASVAPAAGAAATGAGITAGGLAQGAAILSTGVALAKQTGLLPSGQTPGTPTSRPPLATPPGDTTTPIAADPLPLLVGAVVLLALLL